MRQSRLLDHVLRNWPAYAAGVTLLVSAVVVGAIALSEERTSVVFFLLMVTMVVLFLLLGNLWLAAQFRRTPDYVIMFEMGAVHEDRVLVVIDVGRRDAGIKLHRRLHRGKVLVFDVYHPQLTPSIVLARTRRRRRRVPADPRLVWRDGSFNLISLPDHSVECVMLPRVLSEFWEQGDREILLGEVFRILRPGGQLLLSEKVRTPTNWILKGPLTSRLLAAETWRHTLEAAGFNVQQTRFHQDAIACFQARRPTEEEARQLIFEFGKIG